jgi:3-phosphoshikimate 1-carboxyvinyltransferase
MGVEIETNPEGFHVPGRQKFHAAEVDSAGDHRIAMAFAVAALCSRRALHHSGSESAGVSFPEFFATLQQITQQ